MSSCQIRPVSKEMVMRERVLIIHLNKASDQFFYSQLVYALLVRLTLSPPFLSFHLFVLYKLVPLGNRMRLQLNCSVRLNLETNKIPDNEIKSNAMGTPTAGTAFSSAPKLLREFLCFY